MFELMFQLSHIKQMSTNTSITRVAIVCKTGKRKGSFNDDYLPDGGG